MDQHYGVGQAIGERPFLSLLRAHVSIARPDHWVKNVFVLPGIVVPLSVEHVPLDALVSNILVGLVAVCLVTSSNYVLNEVLDAPFDVLHPTKHTRPAAQGEISNGFAYFQWLLLVAIAVYLGSLISPPFVMAIASLWVMGFLYNVPPVRTKNVPYLDVLTESTNNPIRLLIGWYMVTSDLVPPVSLLASYWMTGCYFMALKRFAEYRGIGDSDRASQYRKSFARYTETSLLVSVMFYASAGMLFFGSFLTRYRMELVLAFPFIAAVMGIYLWLAFQQDSAAQAPEKLYRQKPLMVAVISCMAVMISLFFWDIPHIEEAFSPTLPAVLESGSR